MAERFIEAGRLNSPRGIKGEVRFACYCDSPDFLSGVSRLYLDKNGEKFLEIVCYRPSIPSVIFKGYESRELAAMLNGRAVWFDRNDVVLPEGAFYFCDMLGEKAYDAETGEELGTVTDIEEGVASFYYIVSGEKNYRVPAVDEFVASAFPGKGLHFRPEEGLEA